MNMNTKLMVAVLALFSGMAWGQGTLAGVNGDCTIGGQQTLTQGLASTATQQIGTTNSLSGAGVMASFPLCSVTVYLSGTSIKANLFSNNLVSPTSLSNPFTANTDGSFTFDTGQGACYDITASTGAGPALPYSRSWSNVCLGSGSGGGGGGTVNLGIATFAAYYPASGTAVSSTPNLAFVGSTSIFAGTVQLGSGSASCGTFIQCIAFPESSTGTGNPLANNGWMRFDLTNHTARCENNLGAERNCDNVIDVQAKGDGTTDDTAAIQAAVNLCPQTGTTVGCTIQLQAGDFKITSAINLGLLQGVTLQGTGTLGVTGSATTIETSGAIYGIVIGTGSSPDQAGFMIRDIGFKDLTGNGLGGIHLLAVNGGWIERVACNAYYVGACIELDGGSNFTQFIHIFDVITANTKFRVQTTGKTASNYVFGGMGTCGNLGNTDVIAGSVDIDLGYTNHVSSQSNASETMTDTQSQNCSVGIGLFNSGGNHFYGKAMENGLNNRGSGTIGVAVTGDSATFSNGNVFDGVQVVTTGTGYYIGPNTQNTTILTPIFNGTNGVDLVIDQVALGSSRIVSAKRFTGWQTNISSVSRLSNIVTVTTTFNGNNGLLSIYPGSLVNVYNIVGGTTSFNGQFPVTSVSTNDSTGITTLTWAQTGANESTTVNTGACGGAGSCVGAQSTILSSGVGIAEYTGDNVTQDMVFNIPFVPNQGVLPQNCLSATGRMFYDGSRMDICEGSNGITHMVDGYVLTYNGNQSVSYVPQPTTTVGAGITGVPNCSSANNGVCQSSDDKRLIMANNTAGSTLCLPPPGLANGYPPGYSFKVTYIPGSGNQFISITPPGSTSLYSVACPGAAASLDGNSTSINISIRQGTEVRTNGNVWATIPGAASVPVDQITAGLTLSPVTLIPGSWSGAGSGANSGQNFTLNGGNSNSTGGVGGDIVTVSGSDPASGIHGSNRTVQTMESGVSLTSKNGYIVRSCRAFDNVDCSNTLPANTTAARMTVPGSTTVADYAGAIGIVYSGANIGSPSQIQIAGVYKGAVTVSNCTPGQYYEISSNGAAINGQGDCSPFDSPRRVGYTLSVATGSTGTPGAVDVLIQPFGGSQLYKTVQAPTGTLSPLVAITNTTGALQEYFIKAVISCRATAAGDTANLNVFYTDGSSTVQNFNAAALCTTLGSASWAEITHSVLVGSTQTIQWQINSVTNTHTSTWDMMLSVDAVR